MAEEDECRVERKRAELLYSRCCGVLSQLAGIDKKLLQIRDAISPTERPQMELPRVENCPGNI